KLYQLIEMTLPMSERKPVNGERMWRKVTRKVARYFNRTGEFRDPTKRHAFEVGLEPMAKRWEFNKKRREKTAAKAEARKLERRRRKWARDVGDRPMLEIAEQSRKASGEEKLRMLGFGTDDPEDEKRWEAESGIPADIFLVKDPDERRAKFDEWRDQK